ncbi:MAG: hypothetical protein IPL76_10215 [Gemmatimonadetes bacterium]|nr:hypothetical protein [Gemmatimonadota bacterium]
MMRGILVVLLVVGGARGNVGTGERGNVGTMERGNEGTFRRSVVPPFPRSAVPPSRRSAPTPFRLPSRQPVVRYGAPPAVVAAPVPRPPKPALALTGVLWGPEPAALLLGIPGTDGEIVVHRGETHGPIHVRAINPQAVELEGMDTTWTLTVRTPW